MAWLLTDTEFELVVGDEGAWLHGHTQNHEWLAYGEGLTSGERESIHSRPLQWEIRRKGSGHAKRYLEPEAGTAPEGASTVVRMSGDLIVAVAEIDGSRWRTFLRSFEMFAMATFPKYFQINIPFESLSTSGKRSPALEQFLAGNSANASTEEASVVFSFGNELPEELI